MELFPRFQQAYPNLARKQVSRQGIALLEQFSNYNGMKLLIEFLNLDGVVNLNDSAFSLIDPKDFQEDISLFLPACKSVVFAKSSFGDLFFVSDIEKNAIFVLHSRYDWYKRVGLDLEMFFESGLVTYLNKIIDLELHIYATERLGKLLENEVFGFEPALAFGGNEEDLDSIKKFEIHSHLAFLSQLVTVERR
jgi:hypothetical protein